MIGSAADELRTKKKSESKKHVGIQEGLCDWMDVGDKDPGRIIEGLTGPCGSSLFLHFVFPWS